MTAPSQPSAPTSSYVAQVEELFNLSRKLSDTHKKHCYCGICQAAKKITEYVKNGQHKQPMAGEQ